jgi:hypothetical protein
MRKLKERISYMEQEDVILKQQLWERNSLISAYYMPVNDDRISGLHQHLITLYNPLEEQLKTLLAEKQTAALEHEKATTKLQTKIAKMERKMGQIVDQYKHIWSLYCNFAYDERDKLHAQIVKWKKKCGVQHYVRSTPSSNTVHEQRLVRYTLQLGSEGLDKNMLPQEYFDPGFTRGAHAATHLALQKLWPDLWQHHWWQVAWIGLSVPMLTGEGEIGMDPEQRAESNERLEEFERELRILDEETERRWSEMFDRDDLDSDDEEDGASDSSIEEGNSAGSDEDTDETSPPHSKPASPKPKVEKAEDEADRHDSEPQSEEEDAVASDNDTNQAAEDHEPEAKCDDATSKTSEDTAVQDEDGMPAFFKKKLAKVAAGEEKNKQLVGYISDDEIDQEGFMAQYGRDVDGKSNTTCCTQNGTNVLPGLDDEDREIENGATERGESNEAARSDESTAAEDEATLHLKLEGHHDDALSKHTAQPTMSLRSSSRSLLALWRANTTRYKWEYALWNEKTKKDYHKAMVAQLNGH